MPFLSDALWVNAFAGVAGIDRLFAGAAWSGLLKLLTFVLFMPFALLWQLLDTLSLLSTRQFAFGPRVTWQPEPAALIRVNTVGVGAVHIVLLLVVGLGALWAWQTRSIVTTSDDDQKVLVAEA